MLQVQTLIKQKQIVVPGEKKTTIRDFRDIWKGYFLNRYFET